MCCSAVALSLSLSLSRFLSEDIKKGACVWPQHRNKPRLNNQHQHRAEGKGCTQGSMVVSESPSKEGGGGRVSPGRQSSVSPTRQRASRLKPRQDWLVAVGQGHSPARTLRRESKDHRRKSKSSRPKKFDSARLSFGGLEQQVCVLVSRRAGGAGGGVGGWVGWGTPWDQVSFCCCCVFVKVRVV